MGRVDGICRSATWSKAAARHSRPVHRCVTAWTTPPPNAFWLASAAAPRGSAHGCDQSDPRLPDRTRDHGPSRIDAVAQGVTRDPEFELWRALALIADLAADWRRFDGRIAGVSADIELLAEQDGSCQRLMTVPGIGPIISSAVVAAIGNGAGFKQGRDFGAWLGLVSRRESTGDRTVLGKISKRGNKYLRTLSVQAARVVLVRRPGAAMRGLWPWIVRASKRLHSNMLAIALANKLARIAWAVLAHDRRFVVLHIGG
jgi:transposase